MECKMTTKKSGIIAALIFLIIGTLHLLKGHNGYSIVFYALAGIFFVMTQFFPEVFTKITRAIGEFITKLILCVIFYSVVTPTGLIMRLFGKDPLDRRIEKEKDSYWTKKEGITEDGNRYEKQF